MAKKSPPRFVSPMLAKLVRQLPEGALWRYEAKWDGFRILALKEKHKVRLLSRRGSDFSAQFKAVARHVGQIHAQTALLDGEVVALDSSGQPSFQMLQNRRTLPAGYELAYYAFDLLHLDGADLRHLPLQERKARLAAVIKNSHIRFSANLPGSVPAILDAIRKHGLEGVVAKRADSVYEPGQRSGAWVKLPLKPKDEFLIGAYRPGAGTLELMLVGRKKGSKLMFRGKVRQGLNRWNRKALASRLKRLRTAKCPFANLPSSGRKSHWGEGVAPEEMPHYIWVKPKLIADIRYTEWTESGVLRHAEYVGIREDLLSSR